MDSIKLTVSTIKLLLQLGSQEAIDIAGEHLIELKGHELRDIMEEYTLKDIDELFQAFKAKDKTIYKSGQ